MPPTQIFLLSPASCSGRRAALLLSERAELSLAVRLRSSVGAPLGEVFAFLSGLYFRGKLTYARAFARPPGNMPGAWVITAGRGLVSADTLIRLSDLAAFADVPIDVLELRYREPLVQDAAVISERLPPDGRVVLLGSIATNKYAEPLGPVLGQRLVFPLAFVGRGDMSRGGLMLRCVDEGRELEYVPVETALRRGPRPVRLPPRR